MSAAASCGQKGRWSRPVYAFLERVAARYPAVLDFDPCPCGITIAIIAERHVQPVIHFPIRDRDLIDEARTMIELHPMLREHSNHHGDDAVLILCEQA